MRGEIVEIEAGEPIEDGEPVIMRDGKAWPDWAFRLQKLRRKHGIYGVLDPGGAELTHPQFGQFRVTAMDDKYDHGLIVAFLRKNGVDP